MLQRKYAVEEPLSDQQLKALNMQAHHLRVDASSLVCRQGRTGQFLGRFQAVALCRNEGIGGASLVLKQPVLAAAQQFVLLSQ